MCTLFQTRPRIAKGEQAVFKLRSQATEFIQSLKPLQVANKREANTLRDIRSDLPEKITARSVAMRKIQGAERALWVARMLDYTSEGHHTPLSYAANRGSWKLVKKLLRAGASPNFPVRLSMAVQASPRELCFVSHNFISMY